MNSVEVVEALRTSLSGLMAVYGFGSRVTGEHNPGSDLDVAVLLEGYGDPVQLFDLSSVVADIAGCDVDLLDFRGASTVMQYQILTKGERWWARDYQAGLFEAAVLSEKLAFDESRRLLLSEVKERGSIYGG